ncbi:MAG: 4-oxalocrotonate tautomerase family protein [Marinifilaceae bacterium]|jgi:4-oxalocrotonate tautomerase|nr:4-oxalocrotonate tautomerase family protein [Marinifilaceae bacterium]
MPVVNFIAGKLSKDQKKELIEKFTQITQDITHSPLEFITVVIDEYEDDNLGVAGKSVTEIKLELKK